MQLTIITATFNAAKHLPRLTQSLREQTDPAFEWIVMDGGSQDGTIDFLQQIHDLPLIYRSEHDFGIYDALNKAIKKASGEYYLVMGADDTLAPDGVANYKKLIADTGADILTASIQREDGKIIARPWGPAWLTGQKAYITDHSVGSVFRKSLHDRPTVGLYSRSYPICADHLFVKRAANSGAKVVAGNFLAGCFGSSGISSRDYVGRLTESFRIQLETERKGPQIALFLLRFLKNLPKLL